MCNRQTEATNLWAPFLLLSAKFILEGDQQELRQSMIGGLEQVFVGVMKDN